METSRATSLSKPSKFSRVAPISFPVSWRGCFLLLVMLSFGIVEILLIFLFKKMAIIKQYVNIVALTLGGCQPLGAVFSRVALTLSRKR